MCRQWRFYVLGSDAAFLPLGIARGEQRADEQLQLVIEHDRQDDQTERRIGTEQQGRHRHAGGECLFRATEDDSDFVLDVETEPPREQAPVDEVLVINVIARDPDGFKGPALLQNILESGLRFGEMDISPPATDPGAGRNGPRPTRRSGLAVSQALGTSATRLICTLRRASSVARNCSSA